MRSESIFHLVHVTNEGAQVFADSLLKNSLFFPAIVQIQKVVQEPLAAQKPVEDIKNETG